MNVRVDLCIHGAVSLSPWRARENDGELFRTTAMSKYCPLPPRQASATEQVPKTEDDSDMNSPAINKPTKILRTSLGDSRTHPQDDGSGDQSSQITRRTFCNDLLFTSTAVVLGARTVAGETAIVQESEIAYPARKIEGAEQLIVGSSLYFAYPTRNDPAVLLRSAEGEYVAYSRKCSHAGCSVEFDSERRCLKCPCHQGAFDARIGHVMYGPPRRPLDQIVLQIRAGGQVWAIGKRVGRNGDRIAEKL